MSTNETLDENSKSLENLEDNLDYVINLDGSDPGLESIEAKLCYLAGEVMGIETAEEMGPAYSVLVSEEYDQFEDAIEKLGMHYLTENDVNPDYHDPDYEQDYEDETVEETWAPGKDANPRCFLDEGEA